MDNEQSFLVNMGIEKEQTRVKMEALEENFKRAIECITEMEADIIKNGFSFYNEWWRKYKEDNDISDFVEPEYDKYGFRTN